MPTDPRNTNKPALPDPQAPTLRLFDGLLHADDDWFEFGEPKNALDPRAKHAIAQAMKRRASGLGSAAKRALEYGLTKGMEWVVEHYDPSKGRFGSLAFTIEKMVVQRFHRDFSTDDLRRELEDEHFRQGALASDAAMVRYLHHWERRIAQLQRLWPNRWHVAGTSGEDVRKTLVVELLEALKTHGFEEHEVPGREASFVFVARKRDQMRLKRNLWVMDGEPEHHMPVAPSPETLLIRADSKEIASKIVSADLGLSRTQTRWMAAFQLEARCHDVSGERFNAARAAENLGRDRSSASRMLRHLRDAIVREFGDKEDLLP